MSRQTAKGSCDGADGGVLFQRFQTELAIGHQILHSVIAEALLLLQRGEVDDR